MKVDSCLISLSFLLLAASFFLRAVAYNLFPKKNDEPKKYEFTAYAFLALACSGLTILYWDTGDMPQSLINGLPLLLLFFSLLSLLNYAKYLREVRILKSEKK